ncbi:MAG: murein biosynthesis integral membrane protein MurJ [Burkholderiales bacterium]
MNLLRAVATVSGWTFLSRILGFIRDMIIAKTFGAGVATDAFFVAFRLPNLLRRLFAEGAFSQAFVPILAEFKNRRGPEETKRLIDRAATVLTIALVVVTAIGVAAAPILVYVSAPGFVGNADQFALTVDLVRITFPYILFISLVALAAGILNTWQRFALPAFTPVMLNLSFIVGALYFAPYFDPPIKVLAWALFVGGILQLAIQVPALARLGLLPWKKIRIADGEQIADRSIGPAFRDEGVRRVLRTMGPAMLGVSVGQISLVLNTIFASFMIKGSVSWLYYADRLMEFPAALLGAALGTVLLPTLARHYSDSDNAAFSRLLAWGVRITLMLAAPAALGLALLATPLIATLFQYGAFGPNDVEQTRNALIAYSVGLIGLIMVRVLAPGYYARQNLSTPVRIALVTLVATQIANVVFVFGLGMAHVGLALAISCGAFINAGLLFITLRKRGIYLPQSGWLAFGAKVVAALAAMGGVIWFAMPEPGWWIAQQTVHRALVLTGLVVLGGSTYFGALFVFGFRPRDFSRRGAPD